MAIGTAVMPVIPSLRGMSGAIERELAQVGKKGGKSAGAGISGGILGAVRGVAGPMAAIVGGAAVGGFFKDSINRASDLNETINKSTTIFGKNAAGIDKWAKNAATSVGLSRGAALDAAASFGDMFSQIGFTGKESAKASKDTIKMAADLGSFSNLETGDVLDRISGALRGEYDSLQAVIPNINAARVEKEAMAASGAKNAKSLTAEQKAQAVMNIIQKDGARAMGDFEKTSGGLANQQKILSARFADTKARIGAAFLPIMTRVVNFVSEKGLPIFEKFITFLSENGPAAFAKVKAFIGPLIGVVKNLFDRFRAGGDSASFLKTKFLPALDGIRGAVKKMGDVALPIIRDIIGYFREQWPTIKPIIMGIFKTVQDIVITVMDLIKTRIAFVTKVIGFIWSRWGGQIMSVVGGAFKTIISVIGGALKIVSGVIKTVSSLIKGDWRGAWDGIKTILSGALTIVKAVVKNGFNTVRTLMMAPMNTAKEKLQGLFGKGGTVRSIFSNAVAAIGNIWDGIKSKVSGPVSFVIGVINTLIGAYDKVAGAVGAKTIGKISTARANASGNGRGSTGRVVRAFHAGGYTGPGSKYQPAGVVHADEFVVSKAARRKIEAKAPGILDHMNRTGTLPGFAGGGRVNFRGHTFTEKFAARLQAVERMIGHSLSIFQGGFRPATSYSGTSHRGDAIDIGVDRAAIAALRSVGIPTWDRTGKGNWAPHAHGVPLPGAGTAMGSAVWQAQDYLRGGDGLGGRDNGPRGGAIKAVGAFIGAGFTSLAGWLKGLLKDPLARLSKITGTPFGAMAGKGVHVLAEGMTKNLKGYANGGTANRTGLAVVGERGRETVLLNRGDQVLSNRQSAALGGGANFYGNFYGTDPRLVAQEVLTEQRRHAALHPIW